MGAAQVKADREQAARDRRLAERNGGAKAPTKPKANRKT